MNDAKRLGRGLDSLLTRHTGDQRTAQTAEVVYLPLDAVKANPYQPRHDFDDQRISGLAASIRTDGVLQPIIVRRVDDGYELISGERRMRAAREAQIAAIPAVVREVGDSDMITLALVENLQRADLNPIEKAEGFRNLIQRFNLTQEAIGSRVGMDRSSVANLMRLLELPEAVRADVSAGTITMGHARALLSLSDPARQIELAERIKREDLSVRRVEKLVAAEREPIERSPSEPHIVDLENRIRERLSSRVDISERGGKGRIVIHFASLDDLDRILEVLGV